MPTNDYSKNIVYLSKEQYQELITNETLTVNGQTITYNDNDIYVTPQAEPITDVRIDGTSIGSNGVANIPLASIQTPGIMKVSSSYGHQLSSGVLVHKKAITSTLQRGVDNFDPVVAANQHESIFFGLSKVAGADLKDVSNITVGTYPDSSKAAIQNMLGVTDLISTEESSPATAAHTLNSTFMMDGKLHRATAAIAIGDAVEVGTNCEVVKADEVFVKNTDYALNNGNYGIIKLGGISNGLGVHGTTGLLYIVSADGTDIQQGNSGTKPIAPVRQHLSVFYGLAKAAGDTTMANSLNAVGTYTPEASTAIRTMLGAAAASDIPSVPVQDVQVNGTSILNNGIASIPIGANGTLGLLKVAAGCGLYVWQDGIVSTAPPSDSAIKAGTQDYTPICPKQQHKSVFYGLAAAAGDATQSVSTNAVGTYTDEAKSAIQTMLGVPSDVQVNGTSVISNGVANIPACTTSTYGVVKPHTNSFTFYDGALRPRFSSVSDVKGGSDAWKPLHADLQHAIAFYGLARAAGDATQSASSNAIGTYTTEAKAAIQTMLGIDLQSIASQVDIPLVETVEGTTPSITGQPNVRYVCGEVSTLSITPPANGSMDVIFESGSTAAVLTVPNTVKWPAWFDASSIEANTTYEILITDGVYGSVMTWAN